MLLKTNILRVQTTTPCYTYQAHYNINTQLSQQDILEIQSYVQNLDHNIIYAHPFLYANQEVNVGIVEVLLSSGETVGMKLEFLKNQGKEEILEEICQKLLRSLSFMECRKIKTYFNPFEQANNTIPGLYIEPIHDAQYHAFALLPINLHLQPPIDISSAKLLLNYTTGTFYSVSDIVRVDKQKNVIHFRNRESVAIGGLRKGKVRDVGGLALAERLRSYSGRIRDACKGFLDNWGIGIEGSFFGSTAKLVSVGGLCFRDNEKSLSEIVSPMARNVYNNNFRQMFRQCKFQSALQAEILLVIPLQFSKQGKAILRELQKLAQKNSLKLTLSHTQISSLQTRQQLHKTISSSCISKTCIYILMVPKITTSVEEQNICYFKEEMIGKEMYFHILKYDQEMESDQLDILAVRNLTVLYCKMRLIPWKIKTIPYAHLPTSAGNLNIQEMADGRYSVAIVATMNAFFSKFCCFHAICSAQKLLETIYKAQEECFSKFISIHKICPHRFFLFRTGIPLDNEYPQIRDRIRTRYSNKLTITYIHLNNSHPVRTFIQTDEHHISKLTVKKTQLLLCTQISSKYYLQLEFDEPPIQIRIDHEENDPSFVDGMLELTAKLCYGSVGNEFGKGMGFLGYAAKLNQYREFGLEKWGRYLQEGVMLFL